MNEWDCRPMMGEQVEEFLNRYNILPAEAFLAASREVIAVVA
ncbi:MAG: hypothetical protein ABI988_15545 [Nitrospirota bacterium]